MSQLFSTRKRRLKVVKEIEAEPAPQSARLAPSETKGESIVADAAKDGADHPRHSSFESLGLAQWLVQSCASLGISSPTPVQVACIPQILAGRDVIGCAQTGSGKTAAFALPILQKLSEDPYGIFGVVLTPTRELAFQIADQFRAFGAPMALRDAVIIGGLDLVQQGLELRQKPHVVIATPGRLHYLLKSADKPDLSRARFLVLDEADRLFDSSFEEDLAVIIQSLPKRRQTLLFSATMTESLQAIQAAAMTDPFRFDATPTATTVSKLRQYYLFMPKQVKLCYLVYLLQQFGPPAQEAVEDDDEEEREVARSVIVFVSTCSMCQTLVELLKELEVASVTLHAGMSQRRRLAALGKFKSGVTSILICTDLASRGLDIPEVDLVVNFDIPRMPQDYIHRVGRTARAGRGGRAVSIVTQFDVELLQHIEKKIEKKLSEFEGVDEENVLKLYNKVATAHRVAKMRIADLGLKEKLQNIKERNKRQRLERQKKQK